MQLKYLKRLNVFIIIYKGKARSIGYTKSQAIENAMQLLKAKVI